MKAIIFGASGQDGFYLTRLLTSLNIEVTGISRSKKENFISLDDFSEVSRLIENIKPDYIFHLAAISATSHHHLLANFSTIVDGSVNLLEAVKRHSPSTKVFLSGSGLQFRNRGKPISEFDELLPGSAYAMARIQSLFAARYFHSIGVKVYFGSFFNHDSPLREEKHVTQMIARAVKRIHKGSDEKIIIGNLDVQKEWGFAGDIVEGIWTFVNQNEISECVIGVGKAYSIREWLQACFGIIGKNWNDYVEINKTFVPEYSVLVSDPSTLFSLGWRPKVDFSGLAKMMLSDAKF